jgi:hypothetical protein
MIIMIQFLERYNAKAIPLLQRVPPEPSWRKFAHKYSTKHKQRLAQLLSKGHKRIRLGFKSSSTSRACISPHHPRIENAATSSASKFRDDFGREMHISVSLFQEFLEDHASKKRRVTWQENTPTTSMHVQFINIRLIRVKIHWIKHNQFLILAILWLLQQTD